MPSASHNDLFGKLTSQTTPHLFISQKSCNFANRKGNKNKTQILHIMNSLRNIKDVARYLGISLLSKGQSVSPLKLQKILYYTQSWYMVYFGKDNTLFKENPQAWVNGPVYPEIYKEYRTKVESMRDDLKAIHFGCTEDNLPEEAEKLAIKMALSFDEIECIKNILHLYGKMTQDQLVFLSHSEDPWADQRRGLRPFDQSANEISLEAMYTYYKTRYDNNRKNKA